MSIPSVFIKGICLVYELVNSQSQQYMRQSKACLNIMFVVIRKYLLLIVLLMQCVINQIIIWACPIINKDIKDIDMKTNNKCIDSAQQIKSLGVQLNAKYSWKTALLFNDVSQWLGANLESALRMYAIDLVEPIFCVWIWTGRKWMEVLRWH